MKYSEYIPLILISGGLIIFGALVHATNNWRQKRALGEPFTALDFFIGSFTASFSGVISGLLVFATVSQDLEIVALAAAMGAFLGMTLMNQLAIVVVEGLKALLKSVLK